MWFQERVNDKHDVVSREKENRWQSQCGINKEWMVITHIVVSGKNIWQSLCDFNREWMAITVWYQERTDGSHNVVSKESEWQSQCGVKREQITISV